MLDITWYNTLNKPLLTPPAWIFAPVWTVLYITLLASFLFYASKCPCSKSKSWGYVLFFCQLALNFCWTPAFFYLHNIGFALAVVIIMDVFTALMIFEFYKISKTASLLLIPYFIWILFATYLNIGYLVLN